jgi:16S rRNA (adenine1518-N6/adenine1519-N6)-dimethyltransferase
MLNLSSPKQASDLLKAHGIRAQKRLGQNFLCDRNTLNRIVSAANLTSHDRVVEIGGGLGALTLGLADISLSVTTIEIDRNLEPILRDATSEAPNVSLVFEDFLRMDVPQLFEDAFGSGAGTVVANIPYYITTPILEILLDNKRFLKRIVLLVQREFAVRMAAPAGSDACGALSLYAQYHARVELLGTVPNTVFLPAPDVSSEIVALSPVLPGTVTVNNETRMFALIRAAFGQRRKTLVNALMRAPASFNLGFNMDTRDAVEAVLERAGIDGTRRGETLTLAEFARLADCPTM